MLPRTRKKDDKNTDETEAEDASSEEESEDLVYKNGTYTGDGQGFGGNIQVQVTLENDTITDIQVVSAPGEDSAYLSQGQGVISTIWLPRVQMLTPFPEQPSVPLELSTL